MLGTAALRDPDLVASLAAEYGERIVAAVDARSGKVAVEGWEHETATAVEELMRELARRGVRRFVYTPVEVDGTLGGPDLEGLRAATAAAAQSGAELLYSGGVGSLEHLRTLASLKLPALSGVVVGRALYDGRFTVAEGQAALERVTSHRWPADISRLVDPRTGDSLARPVRERQVDLRTRQAGLGQPRAWRARAAGSAAPQVEGPALQPHHGRARRALVAGQAGGDRIGQWP